MEQDDIHLYFLLFHTGATMQCPVLEDTYALGQPSLPVCVKVLEIQKNLTYKSELTETS